MKKNAFNITQLNGLKRLYTFIGRFEPGHLGHMTIVKQALRNPDNILLLLIGSSNRGRSLYTPLTFQERAVMLHKLILETLGADAVKRTLVAPIPDTLYNDNQWMMYVQRQVKLAQNATSAIADQPFIPTLIGHSKDHTSYYLKNFPQWQSESAPNLPGFDATTVRQEMFGVKTGVIKPIRQMDSVKLLADSTIDFLEQFSATPAYERLCKEGLYVHDYVKTNQIGPYEIMFTTTDAVVVQSGHILLVERKDFPGKGLLALPGGFLQGNQTLLDSCLRELREESRLRIPAPILKDFLKDQKMFDDVHRSQRGRVTTQAFKFELPRDIHMESLKGGSDAKRAFWLPLSELRCEDMFEDHFFIIQNMLGLAYDLELAAPTSLENVSRMPLQLGV